MNDEKLKIASCKGTLVAFTYGRLKKNDVQTGLYKYDIQSSDDGFSPIALKESIIVNHWGTLLSRVPFSVDKHGWFLLNNADDFIEHPSLHLTQSEFMNLSNETIQNIQNQIRQEEHIYAEYSL